jgi:thymidylate synthase (FAD)
MVREMEQSVELLNPHLSEDDCLELLSKILMVPYSKGAYDRDKAIVVLGSCVRRGHLSVLEHLNVTLKCVTNIGTYKDYTRHRHCAFTIESTSFVKYTDGLPVITADKLSATGLANYAYIEQAYKDMAEQEGIKSARDILPQATVAVMILTSNFRELRHIIQLRGDPNDNPLTGDLRNRIWKTLNERFPLFFPVGNAGAMTLYDAWGEHKICVLS